MRHFINVIALVFTAFLFVLFFYNNKIEITQEVLDLFPQTKDKKIIDVYQKFANSNHILVAIKGFEKESRDTLDEFLSKLKDVPNIDSIMTRTSASDTLEDFLMQNYLYTATPQPIDKVLTKDQIETRVLNGLETLQAQMLEEETLDSGLIEESEGLNKNNNKENTKTLESTNMQNENNPISKTHNTFHDNAPSYNTMFHPSDPLQLLTLQIPKPHIFVAKNYGYMAIVTMKDVKSEKVQETLDSFMQIAKEYPDIRYFSQNFMNVENLGLILNEVNFLLSFATLAFIVLYFVIIRIPLLTLNTICTLITANIIAILVVSSVYPKVTIMALSFGMGISNIAIDYMMHHNFFNLYVGGKRVFNRPVFYGYITTIIGFSACLFIPFPLLAQLSLYAIISLTFCYISFAFMYPQIGFSKPRLFPKLMYIRFQKISSYWFLGIALCGFIIAFMSLRLDFDLSKLDYQNKHMLNERTFFADAQGNTTQILLSSNSLNGLITLARETQEFLHANNAKTFIPLSLISTSNQMELNTKFIESEIVGKNKIALLQSLPHLKTKILQILNNDEDDLESLEDKMASIDDLFSMFKESYVLHDKPEITLDDLSSMGFNIVVEDMESNSVETDSVVKSNNIGKDSNASMQPNTKRFYYLTIAHNSDLDRIDTFSKQLKSGESDIEVRGLQHIMDNLTNTIYKPMLIVLAIALCLMIGMLFITAREAFFDSVVFVLFPLSCTLCVIASHSTLNIMHLFALLILVVVSVDYGIYSVKEGKNLRTAHAIFFSILTTGLSFGILIISETKALNSFGEVIFVGMLCILALLILHRPLYRSK